MTYGLPLLSRGVRHLRSGAARLTSPLLPDDYLSMINPLWSARELRGRVVTVIPETADAATLVIQPGWGWQFDHKPGQYVGIGVAVGGRFRWRSYSLTSAPTHHRGRITITVKAMPEGLLSEHLVRGLEPGTIVRLAPPRGEFVLPDPPPPKILFVTAGSGITPVMAMLRTMDRRGTMPDVVLTHSAPDVDAVLFRDELHDLERRHPSLELHEQFTRRDGRLSLAEALKRVCPDWRHLRRWRGRRRHRAFRHLRHHGRGRWCDHAHAGRRAGRHPDALRLPHGHLPHVRGHARQRARARPAQRHHARRRPPEDPDVHHRSRR